MVVVGLAAAYASVQYKLGSLQRMGPGFFPCAVGVMLAVAGLLIALSARGGRPPAAAGGHHPAGLPDLRGGLCIVAGTIAFVVLGNYCGLLPATFAIVFISAMGDRSNTVLQAVVLSLAMMVIATVVFWWALQLQLPLVKWGA
ncbi:tripartite tricarboxylate transporter TctB family protein [Xylophilus sp. Kf1]|nr:tripartite tricarboxylate transporter TctB family protein [Xylophilus sp. Kf1]